MTARTDQLELPPLRWLAPFAGFAFFATIIEAFRRRARTPTVGPMSDHWLREHAASESWKV